MQNGGKSTDLQLSPANRLTALLKIQPGESRLVGSLALLYFVLALSFVFIQSMAFGLFVAEFGPNYLPFSYISVAIFATALAVVYLKLGERLPFSRLLTLNLAFLACTSFLIWLGLLSPLSHYVAFLLPLWFQILLNLSNLAIWPLAGRLMDIQQGKRLFGLVGAGMWLANIIGGFFIPALVRRIGTVNLLLLAVFSILAALYLLRRLLAANQHRLDSASPATVQATPARQTARWRPDSYILAIFGYTILWWMAFYFVDNIFYNRLGAQFPDADQLTAFMGVLLSVTGLLAFVTTTFLTSRIISRFGLRFGLLGMPLLVTVGTGLLAASGSLAAPALMVFGLSVSVKLVNVALGFSLSQSANAIVYQSLSERIRPRVQTTAEGIVQPIAIGSAGLLLLGLTAGLGFDYIGLSIFLLALCLAWILAILLLSRGYIPALTQTINRRRLGETPLEVNDPTMLALLREHLADPQPGAVLYSIARLELFDLDGLLAALPALARHPAAEVRREAYTRLERYPVQEALPLLLQQLEMEGDPAALEAGLLALAAVSADRAPALLSSFLDSGSPQAVRGALAGLLKYHDSPSALLAFEHMLHSESDSERMLAAQVLGRVSLPTSDEQAFLQLLEDPSPAVRREALRSAARLPRPGLLKALLAACDSPHTSRLAVTALVAAGSQALPEIAAAFSDPTASGLRRTSLAQVLGEFGSQTSVDILLPCLSAPDPILRTQVLQSLSQCAFRSNNPSEIKGLVETEVRSIAWTCAALRDLDFQDSVQPLAAALTQHLVQARLRLLLLLSFILDSRSILAAHETLASGSPSRAGYAVEIVETQLPAGLNRLVSPVLDLSSPPGILIRLAAVAPQPQQPPELRLQSLISGSFSAGFTPWLRACAIYTAVGLQLHACREALNACLADPHPLLSETARWALTRLSPTPSLGEAVMLSTVEKVLILKSVSMFTQTPDEVLADVAALLVEVDASPGQTIIALGEQGDSLYVIMDGKVRVHHDERLLSYLGEREVFGEMALLDPEPRMASVTAVEATRLLRLDQAAFYQLVYERPEVSIGIIHVLTARLRSLTRDTAPATSSAAEQG